MAIDPDATPEGGLEAVPEEPTTSPDLAAGLRCPECLGERMILTLVERDAEGAVTHAVASPCPVCKGAGTTTRSSWREWHARREGRPSRS
jgi:hypothetical protein